MLKKFLAILSTNFNNREEWLFLDQLSDESKENLSKIAANLDPGHKAIYLSLDNGLIFTHAIATRGNFDRRKPFSFKARLLSSTRLRRYALRALGKLANISGGLISISAIRSTFAKQILGLARNMPSGSYVLISPQIYSELQTFLILNDQSVAKPSTLGLCMSNRCNLTCDMCPYHGPSQKKMHKDDYFDTKDVIDPEDFSRVVDYCNRNSVYLQLGQQDEALMYLLIDKFYNVILDLQSSLSITTNGTLLGIGRNTEKLLAIPALAHLSVSIDAASDETYKYIRGGNYSELRSRIIDFFEMAKLKRPDIKRRVCMVLQEANEHEEIKFFEEWKTYVHQISYYKRTDTNQLSGITSVSTNNPSSDDEQRYCCTAAHGGSYVMPNMDVLPCCLYMYEAPYHGRDVLTTFSDEFWTDPKYTNFRSNLVSQNFQSHCKNCNFWRAHEDTTSRFDSHTVKENNYEKHIYIS
jgi:radical SAM protein with 4Fe4S-binding SPASM domain